MKIEITKAIEAGKATFKLAIDGKVDEHSVIVDRVLYIRSYSTLEQLGELSLSEFTNNFTEIGFSVDQAITDWSVYVSLYLKTPKQPFERRRKEKSFSGVLELLARPKDWNKNYSVNFLEGIYKKYVTEDGRYKFIPDELGYSGVGKIYVPIDNTRKKLKDFVEEIKTYYVSISKKVLTELSKSVAPDLFTTFFEFPAEIKTACKQYLVYFAQFLADMGINADTSIKEEANKVLFTVTPQDGNEALDRIKDALEVYINVPGMKGVEIIPIEEPKDIAILQWEANIHHLRGQLALQQATIQAKDATIETLQLSNYILKDKLSELPQIENKTDEKKEEKVVGGVVTVRKYDGKFFSIDFPAIIRKLKRKRK